MQINIYQGIPDRLPPANITIVIDVIRAFTVAHYAFIQGVNDIFLAETVEQAFQIKKENPEYFLAGEVAGLPINGFDLDNSPFTIKKKSLKDKTLVQKTTNGVRATLNCLSSEHLFVTGFTNARKTADHVRERSMDEKLGSVNIIASHPTGDDDLACAEYMKGIIEGKGTNAISAQEVKERIEQSHVAEKFFKADQTAFRREDILYCMEELNTDFVMKVNKTSKIPMIERVKV